MMDYDDNDEMQETDESKEKVRNIKERNEIELEALHRKFVKWYDDYVDEYQEPMQLMQLDRNYFDSKQWTDDEIAALSAEGTPPGVVNLIKPKLNSIFGVEIETRVDPVGLPRGPSEDDADGAKVATDTTRYVFDENEFDEIRTKTGKNLGIEGLSGILMHVSQRAEMQPMSSKTFGASRVEMGKIKPKYDIKISSVPPDRIFYDIHSRDDGYEDVAYSGILTWMDRETFFETYGTYEGFDTCMHRGVTEAAYHEDIPKRWVDTKKERAMVLEVYYKSKGMYYSAHYTKYGFIVEPKPLPHRDDRGRPYNPLILQATYRDGETGHPYGIVRDYIFPQTEVNKRRSKALRLLSVRQTLSDRRAIQDVDGMRHELSQPDGHVQLDDPEGRFEILPTNEMATGQLQLLAEAKADIQNVGPSPIEGAEIEASSGREFFARSKKAALPMKPFFDNIRKMQKKIAKRAWWMARQYMDYEDFIRIRDDEERTGFRFVGINRRMTRMERYNEVIEMGESVTAALNAAGIKKEGTAIIRQGLSQMGPEGSQALPILMQLKGEQLQQAMAQSPELQQIAQALFTLPKMHEVVTFNDVSQISADIVLATAPDTDTVAQEEFDKLVAMYQANPQAIPFDLIIEASQLRDKRKILDRLRKQQENPATEQAAQQAAQLQARFIEASAQESEADAAWKQARAQKEMAETQEIVGNAGAKQLKNNLDAQKTAVETRSMRLDNQAKQVRLTEEQANALQAAVRAGATVAEIQDALLGT